MPAGEKDTVHSTLVRITHWINVLAIIVLLLSGGRIYNADPLFDFRFPDSWTLVGSPGPCSGISRPCGS